MIKLDKLLAYRSQPLKHWVWITLPTQRKGLKSETKGLEVKRQPPMRCGRNDQRVDFNVMSLGEYISKS